MKKIICVLLMAIVIVSICACKGESAYDIAVRNGFSGSEVEWLESLKGKDGQNGKDGKDGRDGKDGLNYKDIFVPGQEIVYEATDYKVPDYGGKESPYENINYRVTFTATVIHTNEEIYQSKFLQKDLFRYGYHYKIEITGSKENAGLQVPYLYFLKVPENYGFDIGRDDYNRANGYFPFFDKNGSFIYEGEISFLLPIDSSDLVIYGAAY
ncbi:MAG: hypothetical protein II777_06160 [Clostridia bacterium]|nr:hypothetical protein [Clostridia bacterium]